LLRRYVEVTHPKIMAETLSVATRRDEDSSSGDFSDVEDRQAWEDALDEVFGEELVRLFAVFTRTDSCRPSVILRKPLPSPFPLTGVFFLPPRPRVLFPYAITLRYPLHYLHFS